MNYNHHYFYLFNIIINYFILLIHFYHNHFYLIMFKILNISFYMYSFLKFHFIIIILVIHILIKYFIIFIHKIYYDNLKSSIILLLIVLEIGYYN